MKYDSPNIRENILKGLKQNYNFLVDSIEFLPVGEESYSYLIIDKNQNKFFVKYCTSPDVIKNIDLVNKLLLQLKRLDFVVPPIEVNGKTSFSVLKGKIYVFPYIEGQVVNISNSKFSKELVAKLLNVMTQIHSSTNIVKVALPKEDFNNNFLRRLNQIIKRFETLKGRDLDDVKNLLEANDNLIRNLINQHTLLGERYKRVKLDFVLTHGDITGLNIIIFDDNLKLVDWDGAMFAPAERDINFFSSNPYFSINEYLKRMNKKHYDPKLREYYGQQWALASIIGNFEDLVSKRMAGADKDDCIQEINQYLGYYK